MTNGEQPSIGEVLRRLDKIDSHLEKIDGRFDKLDQKYITLGIYQRDLEHLQTELAEERKAREVTDANNAANRRLLLTSLIFPLVVLIFGAILLRELALR